MGAVGEAYDEARQAIAENAADIFADLCTVSVPGGAVNAGDGTFGTGEPTVIENVPCNYEALSAWERQIAGGVQSGADHALEFAYFHGGAYLNVPADAVVAVLPRGLNPAVTFEVTGPLRSSSKVKQRVAAKEVGG